MDLALDTTNELCIFLRMSETESDEVMAEACMSYLLLDVIQDVSCGRMRNMFSCHTLSKTINALSEDLNYSFGMSGDIVICEDDKDALDLEHKLFDYASKYRASHLSKFSKLTAGSLHSLAKTLSDPESNILHN